MERYKEDEMKRQKNILSWMIALALAFGICNIPLLGNDTGPVVASAAVKVGQVKNLKAAARETSVSLSWSKVKKAKSYKVYQQKKGWSSWKQTTKKKYKKYKALPDSYKVKKKGKKYYYKKYGNIYKAVKTVKTNKATINRLKADTRYKFKICAYRGKTAGKYSKAISVKTKKPAALENDEQQDSENVLESYTLTGPETAYKGETIEIKANVPSDSIQNLEWYVSKSDFVQTEDGLRLQIEIPEVTYASRLSIRLTNLDSNGRCIWRTDTLEIEIKGNPDKEGSYWQLEMSKMLSDKEYNTLTTGVKDGNGVSTIVLTFLSDGGPKWNAEHYDIVVEDVTPTAYRDVFTGLGCDGSLTKEITYEDLALYDYNGYGGRYYTGESGTKITITLRAGPRVQAVKLYERSGKVIDDEGTYRYKTYYIFPSEETEDGSYYPYDLELYRTLRNRIEAKLWTSGMDNKEKLEAVATYINETTHYPSEIIRKENNPEFWEAWAVDEVELLYYMSDRPLLNSMMKWQGGITSCVATAVMERVAMEDLGLPYIYHSETGIADGEGVYTGIGEYSSNPGNPAHETFYYKDANNTVTSYDVQGITGSASNYRCSVHDCKSKLKNLD